MATMIVRHKVADYAKWRPSFDADAPRQKAAGLNNPRVLRSAEDKNEVVIIFDGVDAKKAKEFSSSPGLKEAMQKAGVVDKPDLYILESA